MDQILFQKISEGMMLETRQSTGIGTLSEKTLHAVIKRYTEPDVRYHEVKVGGYYADVCKGDHIYEIQTAHFDKLRRKLDCFLEGYHVTVIYPIAHRKVLRWIDEDTGEVTAGRKSPKTGSVYEVFPELYKIRSFLLHPRFHLTVLLIDLEEYRFLNGWSKDRKKGSVRAERIPTELIGEYHIDSPEEFSVFVPDTLPEQFLVKDFARATKVSVGTSGKALLLLYEIGAVKRIGKKGNAWIYCRSGEEEMHN